MATITGKCRLCLEPAACLQRSHIFPAWMYRQMERPVLLARGIAVQTDRQDREHLLCFDCEQHLSGLDGFAKTVTEIDGNLLRLSSRLSATQPYAEDLHSATLSTADADSLARFAVSVFWRAHEASSFGIDLGETTAEECRSALEAGGEIPAAITIVCWYFERAQAEAPDYARTFSMRQQNDGSFLFLCCGVGFSCITRPQDSPLARDLALAPSTTPKVLIAETDLLKYMVEKAKLDSSPRGALARKRTSSPT